MTMNAHWFWVTPRDIAKVIGVSDDDVMAAAKRIGAERIPDTLVVAWFVEGAREILRELLRELL